MKKPFLAGAASGLAICLAIWFAAAPDRPTMEAGRSGKWPAVREAHLRIEPTCAACGGIHDIEVHHRQPFHDHPELELDPTNLITLCRRCHLFCGHLADYASWNPSVSSDAEVWLKKIRNRPYADK